MKVYDKNGWVNWDYLFPRCMAFMPVIGARGTGKTFGLLQYLVKHKIKFIYLRRLQAHLDSCMEGAGNPFQSVNAANNWNITAYRRKNSISFEHAEPDPDGKLHSTGDRVAYGIALSTMATIRGADFSDYDCIVFDEFIGMEGERPIKNEFTAFLNLYETVNRNRELQGKPAVKCIMLGNANKLGNPYLTGWGLMKTALSMIRYNQMIVTKNSVTLVMLTRSPISYRKKDTALYQAANQDFISMAIDNAFRTDATNIKSRRLTDYTHLCSVGEIGIYRRKQGGEWYVSAKTRNDRYYFPYGMHLKQFQHDFYMLKTLYMSKRMTFESYECEMILREYLDL